MSKENILKPEYDLIKTDEFYLFYEMMMHSLKTDNVIEGINSSLYMFRTFLKSGNVILYKKNIDDIYVFKMADSKTGEIGRTVNSIVNKAKALVERKGMLNLTIDSDEIKTMQLIHVSVDSEKDDCILAILNNNKKDLEPQFWERFKDTMKVILKRASSYEKNTRAISTDLLTGLDNRNSYEIRLSNLTNENLVLGVFDLFRLKFVNDNYSNDKGDIYIKEVAKILNKYWPKYKLKIDEYGAENFIDTGNCIYRIGGDEFVLLTDIENLQLAQIKAKCVRDEAEMINLNIDEDLPLGLNYGIVKYTPDDSIKQTFMKADEIMQADKRKMYKKYNIERRQ